MPEGILRCVTYSRVSTERDQSPEAQRIELAGYCAARTWIVVDEIVDHGWSGGTDQRPGLKTLLELVRARKIDVVVVAKLDRLARSLRHLVSLLDEFTTLGVTFVSLHDQVDLSTASGRLMIHMIGAFAEFERALIRERTVLGLAHARKKGKRLGRPRIHDPEAIMRLRGQGLSYREIAKHLRVPMATIAKAIKAAHLTPTKSPEISQLKQG